MADLHCAVQSTVDELIDRGIEVGVQVAVYVEGELVVDCAAGVDSEEGTRRVTGDTLFTIYSASKGVIASAIHILAERGLIDYAQMVAHYWPEFAVEGKGDITVAQALNHLAGIPQFPLVEGTSTEAIFIDIDLALAEVAKLKPIFAPGTRAVYHGLTIGWIAEALARAVDGRSLGQIVHEEIAVPLGSEGEIFLGTPESEHQRMATPFDAPQPSERVPDLDPLILQCVPLDEPIAEILNRPQVRAAQIPSANISVSARALAKHYAALVGEVDGVRLLSESQLERIFSHRVEFNDLFMNGVFSRPQAPPRALVYMLNTGNIKDQSFYGPNLGAFGHDGYGGAFGYADPEAKLGLGYTKTLLYGTLPQNAEGASKVRILRAIYGNL